MELFRNGRVRTHAHLLLWFVLITAFLWVSVPRIFRDASRFSIQLAGSQYHSSDIFLGKDGGSNQLIALLGTAPSSRAVVIFVRHDDQLSESLGMLTAYLAWPHPVRIIDARQFAWSAKSAVNDLHSAAAIAFCGFDPPRSWPRGKSVGGSVQVMPIQEIAKR